MRGGGRGGGRGRGRGRGRERGRGRGSSSVAQHETLLLSLSVLTVPLSVVCLSVSPCLSFLSKPLPSGICRDMFVIAVMAAGERVAPLGSHVKRRIYGPVQQYERFLREDRKEMLDGRDERALLREHGSSLSSRVDLVRAMVQAQPEPHCMKCAALAHGVSSAGVLRLLLIHMPQKAEVQRLQRSAETSTSIWAAWSGDPSAGHRNLCSCLEICCLLVLAQCWRSFCQYSSGPVSSFRKS